MIEIINGSTLIDGRIVSTGGVVSTGPEVEANLVCRGVAQYIEGDAPPYSPTMINTSMVGDERSYEDMTAAELKALCDERGIAYKKNASAKALRALLEDGAMPQLRAADPVDA